jgi:hypothetical protein
MELILNSLIDQKSNLEGALIQTLLIQIELADAMMEPEDPG